MSGKYLLACVVAIGITACSSFSLEDANKMQKGMSSNAVLDMVSKKPYETFPIKLATDSRRDFNIMLFELKLGGIAADYIAAFENDKLLYWGYPYEFNRYPDMILNEIGKLTQEKKATL